MQRPDVLLEIRASTTMRARQPPERMLHPDVRLEIRASTTMRARQPPERMLRPDVLFEIRASTTMRARQPPERMLRPDVLFEIRASTTVRARQRVGVGPHAKVMNARASHRRSRLHRLDALRAAARAGRRCRRPRWLHRLLSARDKGTEPERPDGQARIPIRRVPHSGCRPAGAPLRSDARLSSGGAGGRAEKLGPRF